MKKTWVIRRNSEAVSPVIGTILMVAITIVLVAVLFVMVAGLGGVKHTPAVMILNSNSVLYGYEIKLTSPTSEVKWGDVTVQLSDGIDTVTWNNLTTDNLFGSSPPKVWKYGSALVLGNLHVFLNITDISANGKVNQGDSLTFTTYSSPTFSTSTAYSLTLLYELTGGSMLTDNIF